MGGWLHLSDVSLNLAALPEIRFVGGKAVAYLGDRVVTFTGDDRDLLARAVGKDKPPPPPPAPPPARKGK